VDRSECLLHVHGAHAYTEDVDPLHQTPRRLYRSRCACAIASQLYLCFTFSWPRQPISVARAGSSRSSSIRAAICAGSCATTTPSTPSSISSRVAAAGPPITGLPELHASTTTLP